MWYSDQEECFEISDDLDIHERMWSAVQECGSIPGAGRVSTPKLRLLFKGTLAYLLKCRWNFIY